MKIAKLTVVAGTVLLVAGCATTAPTTQKQAYLNRAAGAEIAARNCAAGGGYSSVAQMRTDARTNLAQAKKLGATDAEYAQAKSAVQGSFNMAYILTNAYQACNSLINSVAWAGTETPNLPATAPVATSTK